jgi:hypothetical protein
LVAEQESDPEAEAYEPALDVEKKAGDLESEVEKARDFLATCGDSSRRGRETLR